LNYFVKIEAGIYLVHKKKNTAAPDISTRCDQSTKLNERNESPINNTDITIYSVIVVLLRVDACPNRNAW